MERIWGRDYRITGSSDVSFEDVRKFLMFKIEIFYVNVSLSGARYRSTSSFIDFVTEEAKL